MTMTNYSKHKKILTSFRKDTVRHEKFNQIANHLLQIIQTAPNGSLFIVTGPTGVGKTTVMKNILREMNSALYEDASLYPDLWPLVAINVPTPDSGFFKWKDCYIKILEQFNEPLIDKKRVVNHELNKRIRETIELLEKTASAANSR